jgi:hypothetical protein
VKQRALLAGAAPSFHPKASDYSRRKIEFLIGTALQVSREIWKSESTEGRGLGSGQNLIRGCNRARRYDDVGPDRMFCEGQPFESMTKALNRKSISSRIRKRCMNQMIPVRLAPVLRRPLVVATIGLVPQHPQTWHLLWWLELERARQTVPGPNTLFDFLRPQSTGGPAYLQKQSRKIIGAAGRKT